MGSVNLGVEANTQEVLSVLGNALNSSNEQWEKRRILVALGNINDSLRVLPLTQSFFSSNVEILRNRAFDTFNGAQGEVAFNKFRNLFRSESSKIVRRDATAIALGMAPTEARNEWASELMRTETDDIIRGRAITILGHGLEAYPENEDALRDLLKSVKERELRRVIYTFVSADVNGGAK